MQFSASLAPTTVIVSTQPGEPFPHERFDAVREAAPVGVEVVHFHKTIEQNPKTPGFLDMWHDIYKGYGWREGDIIVASETYGKGMAEHFGGKFMPYDIDRVILPIKATNVRRDTWACFGDILPEFQPNLLQHVTLFGCESTGKTTLSKALANSLDAWWTPEWARPYLENVENVINDDTMTDIWKGQCAQQAHTELFRDKQFVIQDTDLFSTVGYWDFWKPGETPDRLVHDAHVFKSGLYLITQSNIPFEPDPLRYGGDKRESDDAFWIALAEKHGLNYRIIQQDDPFERLQEAVYYVDEYLDSVLGLSYHREYND